MADNLDDFFAKKEKKKKGKTKSKKYTTTDELVKTFETEETEPSEKSQAQQEKTASERNKEDDEWKDFDSGEKDLTGLKIQTLSIGEESKEQSRQPSMVKEEENHSDDDTKVSNQQSLKSGKIWNLEAATIMAQEQHQHQQPQQPSQSTTTTGSYVPPHQRGGTGSSGVSSSSGYGRKKVIPDINSMAAFPTLGQTVSSDDKIVSGGNLSDFQTVRGSSSGRHKESERESIEHRNKYEALQSP